MKNNCPRCEWSRIREESLSDKGPREINQNLLADLFDLVFSIYGEFRGTKDTIGADRYVDRNRVLAVVSAAIDKAELSAMDAWREHRQERVEEDKRNVDTHTED